MAEDTEKTTDEIIEHYRRNRESLEKLTAPGIWTTEGNARDQEYRDQEALRYALDFIDVLLERIKLLDERVSALEE